MSDGGDAACWAHLLCPECGAVLENRNEEGCPRCGAPLPADEEIPPTDSEIGRQGADFHASSAQRSVPS